MVLLDFIRENSIPLKPSTSLVSTTIIIIVRSICLHSMRATASIKEKKNILHFHNYFLYAKSGLPSGIAVQL